MKKKMKFVVRYNISKGNWLVLSSNYEEDGEIFGSFPKEKYADIFAEALEHFNRKNL